MADQRLKVTRLSKTFPGVKALDQVSLTLHAREVVALVGQNGSGKSTLVKAVLGVQTADPGGRVEVLGPDGSWIEGASARAQLHVIHQDLGLVGDLSAVENLDLGAGYGWRSLAPVRRESELARAVELIGRFGGAFDLTVPVARLVPEERTLVAIARALSRWERPDQVLILDEPTAALRGEKVRRLFDAIRRVASEGAAVLFISHRLDEVVELADRVIALRGGRKVADVSRGSFDHDDLVQMIAGRAVRAAQRASAEIGGSVPRLGVRGLRGGRVDGVSFDVSGGEIVGVGGLLGSGREHLCGLIFGARRRSAGAVQVDGRTLPVARPSAAVSAGVGFVPADRREGAIMRMSARENLTLPRLRPLRSAWGTIRRHAEEAEASAWAARVELLPPQPSRRLEMFSGGNQQKVVLARWLRLRPGVLLLDEPTEGVDIGAKPAIYRLILDAAAGGAAVLIASSDEQELSRLCDRVLVMRYGRITSEQSAEQVSEAAIVRSQ